MRSFSSCKAIFNRFQPPLASHRLDVHQDVGDTRIVLLDRSFDRMGDVMAFSHGNPAVNSDMQIDVKNQSHLADVTLLHFPPKPL